MSDRFLGFLVWAYVAFAFAFLLAGNTAGVFGALIMSTLFHFELRRRQGQGDVEQKIISTVARARAEGWYEDDPGWSEVDRLLEMHSHREGGV